MNNLTQPAYPVVPLQDNFKRLIVPIPGLCKLEHFALELYKVYINTEDEKDIAIIQQEDWNACDKSPKNFSDFIMENAIEDAITFLNLLDEKLKTLNNDKSNEMAIFDR